jgi:hypothetical protein
MSSEIETTYIAPAMKLCMVKFHYAQGKPQSIRYCAAKRFP